MARQKRKIDRESGKLADTSIVVIASEDDKAVKQYFGLFESTRVQFNVLNTDDGKSSPQAVLERIDKYKSENQIGDGDEFWIVTDVDHWATPGHVKNLIDVLTKSKQKGISVAISNPCFDLWLLLHFANSPIDQVNKCDDVGARIRETVGFYNKVKIYDLPFSGENVANAIDRARATDPMGKILETNGTHVYKILEEMVRTGIVSLS